MLLINQKANC